MDEAVIILGLLKVQSNVFFVTMSPMPRKEIVVSIGKPEL